MSHRSSNGSWIAALMAAALAADPAGAGGLCKPQETEAYRFACDRAAMDAGTLLEGYVAANAVDEPLPGPGRLTIDGLVFDSGWACVMPVSEPTVAGALTGGLMSLEEAEDRAREMAEAFRNLTPGGSAIGKLAELTSRLKGARRSERGAILQVFSPNTMTWVGQVGAAPLDHDGVGGWSSNSLANLVLRLPEADPEALREGETYRAVAATGEAAAMLNPFFFADWKGELQSYQGEGEGGAEAWRMMRELTAALGADSQLLDRYAPAPNRQVAFEGVKRVLTGRLDGTVTIERVTPGGVTGALELAGTGLLSRSRSEFSYSGGRLSGDRTVETEEVEGAIRFTGRFEAPNIATGHVQRHAFASVKVAPQSPEAEAGRTFTVTRHWPAVNERNLPASFAEGAAGWVEFTEAPDPAQSLEERVTISWLDASGARRTHPLNLAVEGRRILFAPREPLKRGAWYEMKLDGVRAADGDTLAAPQSWRFATLPETWEEKNGLNLYQSTVDADLVVGKPTLARIHFTWKRPEDVHPDWQVKQVAYTAWSESGTGARLHDETEGLLWRDDLHDPDDRLHARDTINLYDWRPQEGEAERIAGVIEPEQCLEPAERFRVEKPSRLGYMKKAVDLRIAGYFVKVGAWRDGVPEDDRIIADRILRQTEEFATQVLPVRSVEATLAGEVSFPPDPQELDIEAELARSRPRRRRRLRASTSTSCSSSTTGWRRGRRPMWRWRSFRRAIMAAARLSVR